MKDVAFYFGCWGNELGHYLRGPSGRMFHEQNLPEDFPVVVNILDSGLLPPNMPETEGESSLCHIFGWTIISFWDRSVDRRGKCNSSFIFRGTYRFHDMLKLAAETFPAIVSRFSFPIVLRSVKQ